MKAWFKLLRPHQWIKSGFVFVGLLFGHAWHDASTVQQVVLAAIAFSLAASSVYVGNDLVDRERDRQHPEKRRRPLASGAISPTAASAVGASCLAAALLLAWLASPSVLGIIAAYIVLNVGYTLGLKHVVLLDVFIISAGFMLRLLAGTVAVGIPPSRWLLLTGLFIALFLGFSKRKAESFHAPAQQRAVLEHYPAALLDTYIAATLTATVITYGLYATSPEALQQHGERLVYTVPAVVFGMLRYAFQVHRGRGEDVSRDLLRDPWILLAGLAWLALFLAPRL